jgi:hypothetical protein
MKKNIKPALFILIFLLILAGCVSSYTPGYIENEQALVVEGLITDQPGVIQLIYPYRHNAGVPIRI